MYKRNDKRYLYYLIDNYLNYKIDEATFCDELYFSYVLEIDEKLLTDTEKRVFSELEKVASRFSEFEEDHKLDTKAFTTKEELSRKIRETSNILHLT